MGSVSWAPRFNPSQVIHDGYNADQDQVLNCKTLSLGQIHVWIITTLTTGNNEMIFRCDSIFQQLVLSVSEWASGSFIISDLPVQLCQPCQPCQPCQQLAQLAQWTQFAIQLSIASTELCELVIESFFSKIFTALNSLSAKLNQIRSKSSVM